ncbi:hypothetical protein ES707_17539 [subsurface metagenome]
MLLYSSTASTLTVKGLSLVTASSAESPSSVRINLLNEPSDTCMSSLVPVSTPTAYTIIFRSPSVFKYMENPFCPSLSVINVYEVGRPSPGETCGSVESKFTVPSYPKSLLLYSSKAFTVKDCASPAVSVDGPVIESLTADLGFTFITFPVVPLYVPSFTSTLKSSGSDDSSIVIQLSRLATPPVIS